MSQGPIEFASAVPRDELGHTEFGGGPGLIQGGPEDGQVVHEPTASEVRGMVVRAEAPWKTDDVTGMLTRDGEAVPYDRATGLDIDPVWVEDGQAGKPVDAPPRTGDPRSAEL